MARDMFRIAYDVKMSAGSLDTAELMLYGEIIEDGPQWWKWSKEDKSAAEFDRAIKEIRASGATKLLVRMNCPGGVVDESIAMRTILGAAGFESIDIRIEGLCASAATNIASIPGAHVAIGEGSEYMIHNPMGGCYGFAEDLENYAKRMRNMEKTTREFYAKKTGQDEEQIKAWMDKETWFTAKEAVEYGFADELLEARAGSANELPAVACVSDREMSLMRQLYNAVPEQIREMEPPKVAASPSAAGAATPSEGEGSNVSNDAPVAGASSEINTHEEENNTMDAKDITQEQLLADNPALYQQIQQAALEADRQRRADIDAITPPMADYQAMAEAAKADGTPFTDYQRNLVAAMKQKGTDYMKNRAKETEPSQKVPGSHADDEQKNEEQQIKQNAEDIAKYAKECGSDPEGSMF